MRNILFCLVAGLLVAGCIASAQTRRVGNSNVTKGGNNDISVRADRSDVNASANAAEDSAANANMVSPRRPSARRDMLYEVCGNPALKCVTSGDFRPEDLPIRIKGELELFGEYLSKPFYAVILKSREPDLDDEECSNRFSEEERLAAQKLFPNNKVFTSAAGCPNFAQIYEHAYNTSFAGDHIIAMYGGPTELAAKAVLRKVLATKSYPDAEIDKVQAILCVSCP